MSAEQLSFLAPDDDHAPRWAHEGLSCDCGTGKFYMVHPSDACECHEAQCICLAEGYAKCDSCGSLRQVWPREMVAMWKPVEDGHAA